MTKLKSISVVLVMLMLVGIFAGCKKNSDKKATEDVKVSKETVFELYNKVQLNQTKEQIDKDLGITGKESTEFEGGFSYVNEDTGYGVNVVINKNNQATAKGLTYPESKRLASLCGKKYTQAQADKIKKGTPYEDVVKLLGGEGIEVSKIRFNENKINTIIYWINKDGTALHVVVDIDGKANFDATFE